MIFSVGCRDDSQHFYFPQTEAVLAVSPCHRVCVSFAFLNSILYTSFLYSKLPVKGD